MTVQQLRTPPEVQPASRGEIVSLFAGWREGLSPVPLRIAMIGTFPPRKCGIATFTCDTVEQLAAHHPEIDVEVYALTDARGPQEYEGVAGVIAADSREDYLRAARQINESGADVVWLQHEFGIFGGPDGELVCDLVDRIAAPLVVAMHTVLSAPSPNQERIVRRLIARASRIMVMSQRGRELLVECYDAPPQLVERIEHGAPDRPFGREEEFKARLGLAGHKVLMTFGLIGPGKGLERMIEALPQIVERHPEVVYRIVGATHPVLAAQHGESYRESLEALAKQLGVEQYIRWDNRFLDTSELLDQIEASDIYVTPYFNLQQATSGSLSYAVALGKAVVSTPYVHARELLGDGTGVLVAPDSSAELAAAVGRLLDDPEALAQTKRRAWERGRATIWPAFAAATARLAHDAAAPGHGTAPLSATPGLAAVFAMSDGTGMLQHGDGVVPDRSHGYCTDDNARALMLMNVAGGLAPAERGIRSAAYAAFLRDAWNPERRRFRNFMRFDRSWCEDVGSEDSNGRALRALGHTAARAPDPGLRAWALRWFEKTAPALGELEAPRTVAFAMLGAAEVMRVAPSQAALGLLTRGGALLHSLLASSRRPDWAWFEAVLAYDNPRLPQALIEAGMACGDASWIEAGLDTLAWIAARQTSVQGHFRPIGSEGFGLEYASLPFDQQPLEAQAAVEAAASAYQAAPDQRWVDHAETAYRWYFGANDRGVVLADIASGRCRDGVTPRGVNENCGAESILAFQLAHYGLMMLKDAARAAAPGATPGNEFEPRHHPARQSATHP